MLRRVASVDEADKLNHQTLRRDFLQSDESVGLHFDPYFVWLFEAWPVPMEGKEERSYRYSVVVAADKLTIWLEDRKTKAQWGSAELTLSEFVTETSAIPNAKLEDYAKQFIACLHAEGDTKRFISPTSSGETRQLTFVLSLHLASFETALVFEFVLKKVPLQRVDILAAQVRDLTDELHELKQKQSDLAFLDLEASHVAPDRTTFVWKVKYLLGRNSQLHLLVDGTAIRIGQTGLYLFTINCRCKDKGPDRTWFRFKVNGEVRRRSNCYGMSPLEDSYSEVYPWCSLTTSVVLQADDNVKIIVGTGTTLVDGSTMTITQLR
ncbi:hypothetical protein Poli38472_013635 [Pythium oligandrum]|uniref:Uncharacterized protein n=1 Tax=Pythium oligandrum TaxID=41045 RepID=A0A8K1FIW5_PYTOL|nr:hypothetical protein Poli38472_013635 [Pythium oligandrum]|eukprot:TMW61172.1 hypothetical protein Poli38472_013635 [Pythium oligandrum]